MGQTTSTPVQMRTLQTDEYAQAFPETAPFWTAAAQSILLLPFCLACRQYHWHPRAFCPYCHSEEIDWKVSPGRGKVYSFSCIRRPSDPYAFGYVLLDEGLILMTNFVDCRMEDVRIDMSVEVRFRQTPQGRFAPFFAPVDNRTKSTEK